MYGIPTAREARDRLSLRTSEYIGYIKEQIDDAIINEKCSVLIHDAVPVTIRDILRTKGYDVTIGPGHEPYTIIRW